MNRTEDVNATSRGVQMAVKSLIDDLTWSELGNIRYRRTVLGESGIKYVIERLKEISDMAASLTLPKEGESK